MPKPGAAEGRVGFGGTEVRFAVAHAIKLIVLGHGAFLVVRPADRAVSHIRAERDCVLTLLEQRIEQQPRLVVDRGSAW